MLLLLLAVLVPSVCLLWFMNQAVHNERLAVRQKLADAYRVNLSLVQNQLEAYWRQTAAALDAEAERLLRPRSLRKQVRAGLADAVVCFDSSRQRRLSRPGSWPRSRKRPEPPGPRRSAWSRAIRRRPPPPSPAWPSKRPTPTWPRAPCRRRRAAWSKRARPDEAIAVLTGPLEEERYRHATDAQGRLIVPNAELMALELLEGLGARTGRAPRSNA